MKKFHPLSYGSSLARELPAFGQELPAAYGGKGKDVKEGLTVKYASTGMYKCKNYWLEQRMLTLIPPRRSSGWSNGGIIDYTSAFSLHCRRNDCWDGQLCICFGLSRLLFSVGDIPSFVGILLFWGHSLVFISIIVVPYGTKFLIHRLLDLCNLLRRWQYAMRNILRCGLPSMFSLVDSPLHDNHTQLPDGSLWTTPTLQSSDTVDCHSHVQDRTKICI